MFTVPVRRARQDGDDGPQDWDESGGVALSGGDIAPGRRTTVEYLAGWAVVAAASWGDAHTSGPLHVVLVLLAALLGLYLLYLGVIYALVAGGVALVRGWIARDKAGKRHRQIPPAWWIVILFWVFVVVGGSLYYWVDLGLRGDEAWWPTGGLVVAGCIATGVFGASRRKGRR